MIAQLLGTQGLPATLRLARYAARGGRARDIVSTLDALVEEPPAPADGGWLGCRRPTRWASPSVGT